MKANIAVAEEGVTMVEKKKEKATGQSRETMVVVGRGQGSGNVLGDFVGRSNELGGS